MLTISFLSFLSLRRRQCKQLNFQSKITQACGNCKIYNIAKFENLCQKMSTVIEEARCFIPRIALIACGSFSPPTPMHLRLFEIARDHFEMTGTHKVIGGIVSPTHDAYGKKGLAPALHRCAMVKLALQSSNWIRLSDWETQQPGWLRTHPVLQYHQNFINNYINSDGVKCQDDLLPSWLPPGLCERKDPIKLHLLCGADLLESFAVPGLWSDDDIINIVSNHGLVVITRFGSNPEKFIFESDILTKYQRNITLVTNWVPNEVSSSMVRRLLNRGQSVKYLLDEVVMEYIRSKKLYNYTSKYITDELNGRQDSNSNRNYIEDQQQQHSSSATTSPDTDVDEDFELMDESDNSLRQLDTENERIATRVFCCGETEKIPKVMKLRLLRSAPGQAIQVITKERGGGGNDSVAVEETKPKKFKISKIENV